MPRIQQIKLAFYITQTYTAANPIRISIAVDGIFYGKRQLVVAQENPDGDDDVTGGAAGAVLETVFNKGE